jgi:hypothetical protein
MKTLLNVVFFQLLWLVCVGGAGRGYWWVGLPVMALFAAYHFKVTPWRVADGKLLLIAIVLGGIVDTLFVQLGLMQFNASVPSSAVAPVWILLLWAGFALTLNHSMSYFQTRFWPALVFGLLGGPLAYYVAKNIWKAVNFLQSDVIVYGALAFAWAVMTPLLLKIGSNLRQHNRAW